VFRVLSNEQLAPDVHRLWVEAPHVIRKRQPGQFVIVRVDEAGERIPLTIADVDPARGALAIIVQGVGKTTRQLNEVPHGGTLADVVGPLGRPTHIERGMHICAIGGGIGTAVVYPIAAGVRAAGGRVTTIIGGRTRSLVLLEDEMRKLSDQLVVTTDDGSYGRKGLVTDALSELLTQGARFDEVVAVGPLPMMRAVCNVTRELKIKTTVSLNPVMVDGTGMCGGCRVLVGGEPKFVCVDGPEFDGHLVDFDELTARLRAYREQEQQALELWTKEQAAREAAEREESMWAV
jgi:ferredoxin--NADP+ reductase